MPAQTLRIIDANCNRIGEGLRFLEDVARFSLDDASLSKQLKTIRHGVIKSVTKLGTTLISKRNSESDVGANAEPMSKKQDLPSLITANAKRVEEGLRVLEELAKLPEISQTLDSTCFQRARFALYTLEKDLLSRILRHQKRAQLTGLCLILDTRVSGMTDSVNVVTQAIRGGAKMIRLHDEHSKKSTLLTTAQKLKELCQKTNTLFIVDDHLDIALAVDADGLHISQEDLPMPLVRETLPIDKVIGYSVTNIKQAMKAEKEGADYIVVGVELLRQIKQKVSIPVVAIGGITRDNITKVIAAGADAVAVSSAILNQKDRETAIRQMVNRIAQQRKNHRKSGKNR